ncbi:MAG: CocE/NonD family hydrolase [Sphingomonadales bacterium]|nr:MAG: CocE/NonD family hydrolase [Sphingomonadales bacterium]
MLKNLGCALAIALMIIPQGFVAAQTSDPSYRYAFDKIGIVERHQLVRMRDGIGLSTDIYRPKDADKDLPTIFMRTPYNIGKMYPDELVFIMEAVQQGYVVVVQNERGRYFSEGRWEILGRPRTDGYDALTWIASQSWSNGKVGTLGCSSSAEWQLALAAQNHPAHAAMVPMGSGAGIGKVGRFREQGNWFTGGAQRSLFTVWLYDTDNPARAQLPSNLDAATRARVGEYNDLDVKKPEVDWSKQIRHLPVADILKDLGEPAGLYEGLIKLKPSSAEWAKGGLYRDSEGWGVPALWFNSWYDVSIGPNLELFNHIRSTASDKEVRDNQFAIVGPRAHCEFDEMAPNAPVGERPMGESIFDTKSEIISWFNRWLKGDAKAFPASTPHVRYFAMGANEWRGSDQWPPDDAKTLRFYLSSSGNANSLFGDGALSRSPSTSDSPDRYVYDPANPVETYGGNDCCNGGVSAAGALDQRRIEARQDVLVYTSDPLEQDVEVSGFVDVVLQVSSNAKDTDFTAKLVDVAPDGTAWIIGDTIFRARYRDGYDQEVFMKPGEIYTLRLTPITTSNRFGKGHRIRIEVTSSNFPKFYRNLNTGGDNVTETKGVVAQNVVHHAPDKLSYIELPVTVR